MMDPIVLYYGKGQLTGFVADPNGVLDVVSIITKHRATKFINKPEILSDTLLQVPADMVVNATLAAMARHGGSGKAETSIYQIASSVVNPLIFQDLTSHFYEHFKSSPCLDNKGNPIHVPIMKLFSSIEDFSSHLWRDAILRSGLSAMPSQTGKLLRKLEKTVKQAKYLAYIYQPYTFYGGR